jgi:aldehyde dehydrogenase
MGGRRADELKEALTRAIIHRRRHKHEPLRRISRQDAAVLTWERQNIPEMSFFGETDESNPFVPVEQMMPFLPFVRVRDVDEAIAKAKHYEHGFRHTSIIHSNNVRNMTRMGRALDTTLFVKNGPCMAALGLGGEGYLSFSIATPLARVTTPLTFTRAACFGLIDDLRILGSNDATLGTVSAPQRRRSSIQPFRAGRCWSCSATAWTDARWTANR